MALMTAQEYIESLRKLNTRVYMFGEKIENWVDHPMIRPSINCVAMTYAAAEDPANAELMTRENTACICFSDTTMQSSYKSPYVKVKTKVAFGTNNSPGQ